jgi:hypothetical protein
MITLEHLKIYFSYKGDGDGFVRHATPFEKKIMNYEDWIMIDSFIQDIVIINNGFASKYYIKKNYEKMLQNCDSEITINELKSIALQLS